MGALPFELRKTVKERRLASQPTRLKIILSELQSRKRFCCYDSREEVDEYEGSCKCTFKQRLYDRWTCLRCYLDGWVGDDDYRAMTRIQTAPSLRSHIDHLVAWKNESAEKPTRVLNSHTVLDENSICKCGKSPRMEYCGWCEKLLGVFEW
ncbi:hypothetical protein P3342_008040 [Pyrenophora teres f. teres]|nr:hypothetical protein P3342_008040 [Pyrenophora teres f. teres]